MYRLFDVFFSLLLSPFFLLITVLVFIINRLFYRIPTFYISERVGIGFKNFKYFKFQSMIDKDYQNLLLTDSERLTRFGKFLRSTSIDELPSIICVLLGDMTFIGPRPLPPVYNKYFNEKQKLRFNVKPGITGLAQVKGRNNLKWKNRFRYDVFYVNNRNFSLNMYILVLTVYKVFLRKDVLVNGASEVDNFNGSN